LASGAPAISTTFLAGGSAATAAPARAKDDKPKDDAPTAQPLTGTITGVSDDGKTITVETAVAGKKKKKVAPPTREVKVTDKTKVEYVGIDAKEDQKLQVGYAVTVTLSDADKDTATAIKVSKSAEQPKKKKKKTAP